MVDKEFPARWPGGVKGTAEKLASFLTSGRPEAMEGALRALYEVTKNYK